LSAAASAAVTITAKAPEVTASTDVPNTAIVSTTTPEADTTNNRSPETTTVNPIPQLAWPMFQHDAQHTGLTTITGPNWNPDAEIRVKWTRHVEFSFMVNPVVASDGAVLVGGFDSRFGLGRMELSLVLGAPAFATSDKHFGKGPWRTSLPQFC